MQTVQLQWVWSDNKIPQHW